MPGFTGAGGGARSPTFFVGPKHPETPPFNQQVVAQAATYTLTASFGAFVLTGFTDTWKISLPCGYATFTFTGNAASLKYTPSGAVLVGSVGTFTLTGNKALFSIVWPANYATFTVTGGKLKNAITWPANYATFTLTGGKAKYGFTVPGNYGSFTVTGGKDKYGITWPAGYGFYTLTGNAASLTYSQPASTTRREWPRRYREMLASRGRGM